MMRLICKFELQGTINSFLPLKACFNFVTFHQKIYAWVCHSGNIYFMSLTENKSYSCKATKKNVLFPETWNVFHGSVGWIFFLFFFLDK